MQERNPFLGGESRREKVRIRLMEECQSHNVAESLSRLEPSASIRSEGEEERRDDEASPLVVDGRILGGALAFENPLASRAF